MLYHASVLYTVDVVDVVDAIVFVSFDVVKRFFRTFTIKEMTDTDIYTPEARAVQGKMFFQVP